MSHDQRPGKLRVVRDATPTSGTRAGDPAGASGAALRGGVALGDVPGSGDAGLPTSAAAAAGGKALPMLQAAIFLLACVIGGVAFVIARPF